jgi:quercetin dioxygenase-like cupin family protein
MADNNNTQAVYVAPGTEEALWFFGMLVLVKASGEQTGCQFCLTEQVGRRGIATPLHRQHNDDETFMVLEGRVQFYLGEEMTIEADAGATAYIPAGQPHAFEVVSETARWLNLTTPNHEAFFRAAGQPAEERTLPPDMPPDMPVVMDAAARYGVEILGPPPGSDQETHD